MTNPLTGRFRRRPDASEAVQLQAEDHRDLISFFDKARTDEERSSLIQQAELRARRNAG